MSLNSEIFRILSRLSPEDMLLLVIAIILLIEGKCDKRFLFFLLLIFIIELPEGLLTK